MSRKSENVKFSNDNESKISLTDRLDFLAALAMDHDIAAKESLAVRIAVVLLSHRNGQTGLICPEHKTIAAEIGCSVSAVKRSISTLIAAGWLNVVHRARSGGMQTSNQYIPNWSVVAAKRQVANGLPGSAFTDYPVARSRTTRQVVYGLPGSSVTGYELSEGNSVNKPSEENARDSGPAYADRDDACFVDGGVAPSARPARSDAKPVRPPYQQDKTEADQVYAMLKRLPWPEEFEVDGEYKGLSLRSRTAAIVHWHRLLRSGVSAGHIYRAAVKHLDNYPDVGRFSLAGFLSKPAHFTFDPEDADMYIDVDGDPAAGNDNRSLPANDNQQPPERKAAGAEDQPWTDDAPF